MIAGHEVFERLKRERIWAAALFAFAAAVIALVQFWWAPAFDLRPAAPPAAVDARESAG